MADKKFHHKFREPNLLSPIDYGVLEQDIYALILSRISVSVWAEIKHNVQYKSNNRSFEFSIDEMLTRFNCSESNLRNNVAVAAKLMIDKKLIYEGDSEVRHVSLLDSSEYHSNSGLFVTINTDAMAIIRKEISRNYSEIDANHYFKLSSKYSRRLLKIVSRWKRHSDKIITLDLLEYKKILGVDNSKYERMESFIRNCVRSPINDLLSHSNGDWTPFDDDKNGYIMHRRGRSYQTIQIMLKCTVNSNDNDDDIPF